MAIEACTALNNKRSAKTEPLDGLDSKPQAKESKPNSFLNFFSEHVITPLRSRFFKAKEVPSNTKLVRVDTIDMSVVDAQEHRGISKVPSLSFSSDSQSDDQHSTSRTPRSILHANIPHAASQSTKMDLLLLEECPKQASLKQTAWNGCSPSNRAQVWGMLLGYEPLDHSEREATFETKRAQYRGYIREFQAPSGVFDEDDHSGISAIKLDQYCEKDASKEGSVPAETASNRGHGCIQGPSLFALHSSLASRTLRQIDMDLPRTHPETPIFHIPEVRSSMRRILYIYGMLNPKKNYVQGMNEILTPLLVVFLSDRIKGTNEKELEQFLERTSLQGCFSEKGLDNAEADVFWAFTELVNLVEDNFVCDHPGILRRVELLEQIVTQVDPALAAHLSKVGVEFLQFSFRWMNCLLMRELPFKLVVHLWDALLAEEDGMKDVHVYICAAMMVRFSEELQMKDFEDSIIFLQHLPTAGWSTHDVDEMVSQACMWKAALQLESDDEGYRC